MATICRDVADQQRCKSVGSDDLCSCTTGIKVGATWLCNTSTSTISEPSHATPTQRRAMSPLRIVCPRDAARFCGHLKKKSSQTDKNCANGGHKRTSTSTDITDGVQLVHLGGRRWGQPRSSFVLSHPHCENLRRPCKNLRRVAADFRDRIEFEFRLLTQGIRPYAPWTAVLPSCSGAPAGIGC